MTDQGRSALAARLHSHTYHWGDTLPETEGHRAIHEENAAAILGEHGLFIADASKHEAEGALNAALQPFVTCSCGWNAYGKLPDRLFLDHILGAP